MDENSVSSQIFLILFSLITPLVQKAKLNFCIQTIVKEILRCLLSIYYISKLVEVNVQGQFFL